MQIRLYRQPEGQAIPKDLRRTHLTLSFYRKLINLMLNRFPLRFTLCCIITHFSLTCLFGFAQNKQKVHSIYIPLADHYAAIIAYEKYRDEMKKADFQIQQMRNWMELRAYFMSGEADMAYVMSPLAMDMFLEKPNFRWIGLMHRDGNALAINDLLKEYVSLEEKRIDRKPKAEIAEAFSIAKKEMGKTVKCGMPALLSTHTVVLYKFMKDHDKTLAIGFGPDTDLVAIPVPPPKAPAYIKRNSSRGVPAALEQSLPWADVVETKGFGHIAWYSKDVIPWPNGHVECITLATDTAIETKRKAIKEVIYFIHKAGLDIENAKKEGGKAMSKISNIIRKHIPEHNEKAIIQSLRSDLNVINYRHMNVDKAGLKLIMDLGVQGGILKSPINIDEFADESFRTEITEK